MQSKQMQELAAAVMALQGQVSALQEAQPPAAADPAAEPAAAPVADPAADPAAAPVAEHAAALKAAGKQAVKFAAKRCFYKVYIVLRSVALTICAVLVVFIAVLLIGISYDSDIGDADARVEIIAFNIPFWLIVVTVAFVVACVVGACIEAIVRSVHGNRKQEGRIAERNDKNRR